MAANQHAHEEGARRRPHEGPKNHFISFAVSIFLTLLAFLCVYAGLGSAFTKLFIFILAVVQVLFQLGFWMHMKDKGHGYAIVGLAFGFIVTLTAVAAVVYWLFW
ncbi:cytochrome C oxidase subunit IV family protein [Paenibacillus sp. y28]|uniref:cytochrome C oxidase subunit IV family protein n=1 Tax=Paenibacillus sp. y28 TaxID=3129110 RepID=UPI0030188537